jgi:hypothetical protein
MSFAGVVLACWVGLAGVAFVAFSGLARLTSRGDVEADLGIVGEAELRMLVGGRAEPRPSLEALFAHVGMPSPQMARMSGGVGHGRAAAYLGGGAASGGGYPT